MIHTLWTRIIVTAAIASLSVLFKKIHNHESTRLMICLCFLVHLWCTLSCWHKFSKITSRKFLSQAENFFFDRSKRICTPAFKSLLSSFPKETGSLTRTYMDITVNSFVRRASAILELQLHLHKELYTLNREVLLLLLSVRSVAFLFKVQCPLKVRYRGAMWKKVVTSV